jgi:hypothetical protein
MPNAYVTSAKFTGGKIELTVVVDDYKSGGYVEISGQATQANGAFANFYNIEEVPPTPICPPTPTSLATHPTMVCLCRPPPSQGRNLEKIWMSPPSCG